MVELTELQCITYNMHGFNQGYSALRDLCNVYNLIMLQEHWLATFELDKLNFNDNFVLHASSAMDDTLAKGILVGRPFGGVAMLVKNDLASKIKFVKKDDRFIIVRLLDTVFVNLYLPCKSSVGYEEIVADTLARVLNCIVMLSNCMLVVGGDFNCALKPGEPMWSVFNDFMTELDLTVTDHLLPSTVHYTFY